MMQMKILLIGGELNGMTLEQAVLQENARCGGEVLAPNTNKENAHPSGLPRFLGFTSCLELYVLDEWWFAPGVVSLFYGRAGAPIDEVIQQGQELLGWSLSTIKAES